MACRGRQVDAAVFTSLSTWRTLACFLAAELRCPPAVRFVFVSLQEFFDTTVERLPSFAHDQHMIEGGEQRRRWLVQRQHTAHRELAAERT
jgi:hypothetical protein